MNIKKIDCNRCGVCCSMGVCDWGILGDEYCIFLVDNGDDTTSCQLLLDKKISPKNIAIGKGCIIKHFPEYDYHKRMFDEWKS